MKTAPELLEAAANLLADRGWIRLYLTEPFTGQGHCAIGAVLQANGTDARKRKVTPVVRKVLTLLAERVDPDGKIGIDLLRAGGHWETVGDWETVAYWNNTIATDGDQVIDLFRGLAQSLREKELVSAS